MSDALAPAAAPDRPPVRRGAKGKAIFAIVAGTALLLGGAGTLAYWSDEAGLAAGPIESGDLDLQVDAALSSVTLQGALGGLRTIDPAAVADVRIVPGDVLTLVQPIEVLLEGDTIEADLTVDTDALVTGELAGLVDVNLAITGLTATEANTYRLTPSTAGELVATITIEFDENTTNRVGVNTQLDLENVVFTLTQAS